MTNPIDVTHGSEFMKTLEPETQRRLHAIGVTFDAQLLSIDEKELTQLGLAKEQHEKLVAYQKANPRKKSTVEVEDLKKLCGVVLHPMKGGEKHGMDK